MGLPLMAQVKIKEKVEIKPEGKAVIKNYVPGRQNNDDDGYGWPDNGIMYMQYGGDLRMERLKGRFGYIDMIPLASKSERFPSTRGIACSDTMIFNGSQITIKEQYLGKFRQWSALSFGKWKCKVGSPEGDAIKDTTGYFASGIIRQCDETFFLRSWLMEVYTALYMKGKGDCRRQCIENGLPDCDLITDSTVCEIYGTGEYELQNVSPYGEIGLNTTVDSSLAAIPPKYVTDRLGDPFKETESWTVPCNGELYLITDKLKNPGSANKIRMTEPVDSVIEDNLLNCYGEYKKVRRMHKGEKLNIALNGSTEIVAGRNFNGGRTGFSIQDIEGNSTCNYYFEDWTDLTFDDVICRMKFVPDDPAEFPGSVFFRPVKDTITILDTSDVIIRVTDANGVMIDPEPGRKYEVEVLEGGEYCGIYSPHYQAESSYFSSVPGGFKIIAHSNPDSIINVLIRVGNEVEGIAMSVNPSSKIREGINAKIEKSVEDIDPAEPDFKNQYGFCRINIMPANYLTSKLSSRYSSPGDTLLLTPIRINMDGDTVDFDQNQLFEIGVKEGCQSIDILTKEGKRGQYFAEIQQPIRIIIADSLEEDETDFSVKLAVPKDSLVKYIPLPQMCPAPPQIELKREGINIEQEEKTLMCPVINYKENEQVTEAAGTAQQFTIMLGETKYFQLIEEIGCVDINGNQAPPTYKIKETKIKDNGEFDVAPNKVTKDYWGESPISFVSGDKEKVCVYWEKRKSIYREDEGDAETNGYYFSETIDPSIIRVIGRYWNKNNKYKVKLKPTIPETEKVPEINIEVVKPRSIGEAKDKMIDVKGEEYNLDNLIIEYAGKSGIPPQLIKGMIEKESTFKPAYRWEPFFQVNSSMHKDGANKHWTMLNNSKFKISITTIGNPAAPNNHTNVFYGSNKTDNKYWGYQGTAWELFFNNCRDINSNAVSNIYQKKKGIWYDNALKGYSKSKQKAYTNLKSKNGDKLYFKYYPLPENFVGPILIDESKFEEIARNEANYYLQYEYMNGRLNDNDAQTRIASSYGLLQMLYTSATDLRDYPKNSSDHLPEYLNERIRNIEFGTGYFADCVKKETDLQKYEENNWELGYERILEIGLIAYNQGYKNITRYGRNNSYAKGVYGFSEKYLPAK